MFTAAAAHQRALTAYEEAWKALRRFVEETQSFLTAGATFAPPAQGGRHR